MVEMRDNRRAFTDTQRKEILYQQDSKCAVCHNKLDPRAIEYDHIKEWSVLGKTIIKNGAALCPTCHKIKTHNSLVKKIDQPKKERKLASKEYLDNLTIRSEEHTSELQSLRHL